MNMFIETAGWIGTGLIVLAYFLVATKRVDSTNMSYRMMNLLGPVGIGINVYVKHSWPALTLQIVWFLITVAALVRHRE